MTAAALAGGNLRILRHLQLHHHPASLAQLAPSALEAVVVGAAGAAAHAPPTLQFLLLKVVQKLVLRVLKRQDLVAPIGQQQTVVVFSQFGYITRSPLWTHRL
jgi:hypothetical protein